MNLEDTRTFQISGSRPEAKEAAYAEAEKDRGVGANVLPCLNGSVVGVGDLAQRDVAGHLLFVEGGQGICVNVAGRSRMVAHIHLQADGAAHWNEGVEADCVANGPGRVESQQN